MGQGRETKGPAPYKGMPGSRIRGFANIEYHLSQPESDRLRLVLNIRDIYLGLGSRASSQQHFTRALLWSRLAYNAKSSPAAQNAKLLGLPAGSHPTPYGL